MIKKTLIIILLIFVLSVTFTHTIFAARQPAVSQDLDVNLRLRSWRDIDPPYPTSGDKKVLIDVGGPTDTLAPQFSTLLRGVNTSPTITNLYQVFQRDRTTLIQPDYSGNWGVTLMRIAGSGDVVVPISGYKLNDEGYEVLLLYASDSDVTIKYTMEDDVVYGYTIHMVDFSVDPTLKALYDANENAGRPGVVALPCGYKLGTANGGVSVAVRDTGTIMDPRIRKDWWKSQGPAKSSCPKLLPKILKPNPSSTDLISRRPTRQNIPCNQTTNPEFHALRPYPGSPCDPLIPRSNPNANSSAVIPKNTDSLQTQMDKDYQMRNSVAFSCGNSLTPNSAEQFDAASLAIPNGCSRDGNEVVCKIPQKFGLTVDLTNSQLPILGNTQVGGMSDAEKMNEYLSWYLNGTINPSQQALNVKADKVINFAGPLQKLIPFDLKKFVREALQTGPVAKPAPEGQYHNYLVTASGLRMTGADFLSNLFKNIPFSSLEDTTGEVVITVTGDTAAKQQDNDVKEVKLTIKPQP